MAEHFTLFSVGISLDMPAQIAWARELMEALDRMEYEDWSDEDTALVTNILQDIDVDDIYGVPAWDFTDAKLILSSDENANLELTASIIQVFLQEFDPENCAVLSYAYTCSKPRPDAFGGGAMFITAADIEGFDATQQANNKAIAYYKSQSKLVEFGSFEEDEKRERWWVSMVGTVAKQWTFPEPVTKAGATKHVETKHPRAKGDIQIYAEEPA